MVFKLLNRACFFCSEMKIRKLYANEIDLLESRSTNAWCYRLPQSTCSAVLQLLASSGQVLFMH